MCIRDSFRPNELVVDVQNGYQEKISEYVIENFPLSSIKDKSMIEEKSLVTPIAVISWKGISIVGLWAFMSLMFIGLIGFYIAIPLMVLAYMLRHKETLVMTILLPSGTGFATWYIFGHLLHLPFPPGLLLEWAGLI